MNSNDIKVVADSSADLTRVEGISFDVASLKIVTDEKEYVDNESLDVEKMVDELARYKGKVSTSCPAPADWLAAFGDSKRIICVTITSALSGSYNAACTAKQIYEEQDAQRKVFIIDSLSAGPELYMIVEKLKQYIVEKKNYDEICHVIMEYRKKISLLFVLESVKNLANNGRVSPFIAKAIGILGIRIVGKASEKGELEQLDKCRGEKRALAAVVENMKKAGYNGGKVRIGHCRNEKAACKLKEVLQERFQDASIHIYKSRGLCSFYEENGGLMIGFEKC